MSTELDQRVRKVELDFARHEGRSAVFWTDQQRTNTLTLESTEKLHARISKESERVNAVEKRFSWAWGVGAGVTGLIATAVAASRIL